MKPGGWIVKDSSLLYAPEGGWTCRIPHSEDSADVYGDLIHRVDPELPMLRIRTYYESRYLEEGKLIHYLRTRA